MTKAPKCTTNCNLLFSERFVNVVLLADDRSRKYFEDKIGKGVNAFHLTSFQKLSENTF